MPVHAAIERSATINVSHMRDDTAVYVRNVLKLSVFKYKSARVLVCFF